jgi:hypothetical protein
MTSLQVKIQGKTFLLSRDFSDKDEEDTFRKYISHYTVGRNDMERVTSLNSTLKIDEEFEIMDEEMIKDIRKKNDINYSDFKKSAEEVFKTEFKEEDKGFVRFLADMTEKSTIEQAMVEQKRREKSKEIAESKQMKKD